MFTTDVKCLNLASGCLSPIRMTRSWGIPAAFAASTATRSEDRCATTTLAFVSFSWKASSSTVYAGLAVVTTPPAQCVPQITDGMSMELGEKMASASPFFHW